MRALYHIDANMKKRNSHENESVKVLYKEFLVEPNSPTAHKILHTHYLDRKKILDN